LQKNKSYFYDKFLLQVFLFFNSIVFLRCILQNAHPATMAASKIEAFSDVEIELAELAKALGHPARVAILRELARRNVCVCGEIVEVLPLAQSTVSQHLKELKSAGLISGTVEGVKSCYCINQVTLMRLKTLLDELFTTAQQNCSC